MSKTDQTHNDIDAKAPVAKSAAAKPSAPKQAAPKQAKAKIAGKAALPARADAQRPSDKVIAFVKRHPVLVAAGGIAVGAAVSALLPRGTTRRWLGRAVNLAEAAGASSLLLGREAGDKASVLGHDALRKADILTVKAEKVAGKAGSAAADSLEKYGLAALAAAGSLARETARKASQLGEAAAEQSGRALHKAQELKDRITH